MEDAWKKPTTKKCLDLPKMVGKKHIFSQITIKTNPSSGRLSVDFPGMSFVARMKFASNFALNNFDEISFAIFRRYFYYSLCFRLQSPLKIAGHTGHGCPAGAPGRRFFRCEPKPWSYQKLSGNGWSTYPPKHTTVRK